MSAHIEKRSEMRYDFPVAIEYMVDAQQTVLKAVAVNVCAGGLAAYVFDPLKEGQDIFIKSGLPVQSQSAKICWIRKEDRSFYLAGLKCR